MEQLTNIGVIRDLMARHGMKFSKSLGQNFLVNPSVCPRIAELGGADSHTGVLEIGPGIGVLTAELAARSQKVVAVELDKRLIPVLAETVGHLPQVTVIQGDILTVDLNTLLAEHFWGMEVVVCANLPYYITSPVIMKLLEERLPIRAMTVMVQKEAAQRICASLPSRQAGAITVAVNYYAEPSYLFSVSKGSFLPAPNVESAVIRLDVRREPLYPGLEEDLFFRIVKSAFAQRRKTLLNSLSAGLGLDKSSVEGILAKADVSPMARAEQLSLEEFGRICGVAEEVQK